MAALAEAPYACPACDSTLYGWTAAHDPLDRGSRIVLDRCESCGLAVTRAADPPDVERELAPLLEGARDGRLALIVPNQRSLAGSLGGAQWAGLEPELRRLHPNPKALGLLLRGRGLEITELSTPFSRRSLSLMWQTMLNAFTLRDNFRRNARAGRIPRTSTKERLSYWLDSAVTVLVAAPVAIAALPLEALGAAIGRGGIIEASARPAAKPSG